MTKDGFCTLQDDTSQRYMAQVQDQYNRLINVYNKAEESKKLLDISYKKLQEIDELSKRRRD